MRYDISVKNRALALRLEGKSYSFIQRELGIASKGTLSEWFRNLELPPRSKNLLKENMELATKRGLLHFNTQRKKRILNENSEAFDEGIRDVGQMNERELMLVGAALYWGEGTKRGGKGKSNRVIFTNSEPKMVKLYMRFLREIFGIADEKFAAELHLYESIDHLVAKQYWSEITGIPVARFWSTNLVSRASQNKRPFNRLPYGTIGIRVSSRTLFNKIMGMIEGLASC